MMSVLEIVNAPHVKVFVLEGAKGLFGLSYTVYVTSDTIECYCGAATAFSVSS